jgi:MFS family permease
VDGGPPLYWQVRNASIALSSIMITRLQRYLTLTRGLRKGTLAISTLLTGVFLFCGTTSRTSNALLGWNCAYTFTSNVMYGVLYAITPELFPTKDRGTGNGVAATANRIFGIMSPIVALYADLNTPVPIYSMSSPLL